MGTIDVQDLSLSKTDLWLDNCSPNGNLKAFIKVLSLVQEKGLLQCRGIWVELSTELDELGEAPEELNYQASVIQALLIQAGFKVQKCVKCSWTVSIEVVWGETDLPIKCSRGVLKI